MSTDVTKTKSPSSSKDKERKSKKDVASPSSTKSNGEKKEKKEKKSTHTRTDSKSRDGSDSRKSKKDKKVGESVLKSSESVSNASQTTDASSSNTSPSGSRGSSIKGMKLPEKEEKKVEEKVESTNKEGPITKDVCAGCHRSIMGDVCHAMNNKWHLYCFTCTTCKTSVSDEYYENDGKPYCKRDFNKLFGTVCSACKKEITGKKLKALEREWHPQCFVCHKCKRSFPDMEYYEREDKQPYCETCYDELEDAAAQ